MKKFCMISFTVLLVLLLASCGKPKTALLAGEFQSKMEEEGYQVSDASAQFSGNESIESVWVALNEDDDYQIEFYIATDESQAIKSFNNVKDNFEDEKGNSSSNSSVSISNYSKYTQTTNGKYYVVSRIGNTFLYVVTASENKDSVNSALKVLDY